MTRACFTLAAFLVCAGCSERARPATDDTQAAAASATTDIEDAEPPEAPPILQPPPDVDSSRWYTAMACVQEPRRSRERLRVADELRPYDDSRRFLAVQMADSRAEGYSLPADGAEVAAMVRRGDLVELAPLTQDYILYKSWEVVEDDARFHFDVATGREVPLLPSPEAVDREKERLSDASRRRGREGRRARRALADLVAAYDDPTLRARLAEEHAELKALAADWGGKSYDLEEPTDRERFQSRLASCVRPDTKTILERLARVYRQRFARPLPVSSLIRTQRHQTRLRRLNKNATRVEVPPHTTGAAFDITYRFMATDEQNTLGEEIALLKREGRVEALRERNNALHVYVLRNGMPAEAAVEAFLDDVERARGWALPFRRSGRARQR